MPGRRKVSLRETGGGEGEVPVYGGTCDNAARCVIRRAIRAVCGEIFPAWNSGLS